MVIVWYNLSHNFLMQLVNWMSNELNYFAFILFAKKVSSSKSYRIVLKRTKQPQVWQLKRKTTFDHDNLWHLGTKQNKSASTYLINLIWTVSKRGTHSSFDFSIDSLTKILLRYIVALMLPWIRVCTYSQWYFSYPCWKIWEQTR